ncbi:DUF1810 domain-containing protein [uncultured Bradyrhizobium sp.]|uniref:DUF1810 domain-containing protein n=1 Tax=uncultured Bradyrhizobium sp. TaxID=199684 RepID=UPI0035CC65E9
MKDPFDLQRFVDAQAPVYAQVVSELGSGRKRSHWMWFVFPQIAGLGHSAMARRYAIASRDEVRSYLAHPILGPRLRECTQTLCEIQQRSLREILGSPDHLKFHSSMTLFETVSGDGIFRTALEKFCAGAHDPVTIAILNRRSEFEGSKPSATER